MTTRKAQKGNDEKLKELILLLAQESENDPNFGAVKLNKELFYSDFLAYQYFGQSITGHDYIALPRGPAPKYKLSIIHQMVQRGDLAVRKHEAFGLVQDRAIALREPELDDFSKDEIKLVHHVLRQCHDKTGEELSTMTHKFCGWRLAQEKEVIPYSVALVGTREPTLEEFKIGQELEPMALDCLKRNERPAEPATS